jgi:hypothetical protein
MVARDGIEPPPAFSGVPTKHRKRFDMNKFHLNKECYKDARRTGILRFGFRSVSETRSVETLRRERVLDVFDGWLIKHALQNQGASAAQTYVGPLSIEVLAKCCYSFST